MAFGSDHMFDAFIRFAPGASASIEASGLIKIMNAFIFNLFLSKNFVNILFESSF